MECTLLHICIYNIFNNQHWFNVYVLHHRSHHDNNDMIYYIPYIHYEISAIDL